MNAVTAVRTTGHEKGLVNVWVSAEADVRLGFGGLVTVTKLLCHEISESRVAVIVVSLSLFPSCQNADSFIS